jgi:hypothetical protein
MAHGEAIDTDGAAQPATESQGGGVAFEDEHRCREFTTNHGVDTTGESDVFGAAICPGCEKPNALTGAPTDFQELTVRCMGCTRVIVLDGASLMAFVTEVRDDA